MRTLQVENKFFHPFRSSASESSRKALYAKDLQTELKMSPIEMSRETLVTCCLTTTYTRQSAAFPLSHPVTLDPIFAQSCRLFQPQFR
jgi:hypothetical protein